MTIDGEPASFAGYSVAVANSGVFGGGMYLAPDAQLDDGLLEVVLIAEPVASCATCAGCRACSSGTHLQDPAITLLQGREITFSADRPFTAYADGDPIADLPADRARAAGRAAGGGAAMIRLAGRAGRREGGRHARARRRARRRHVAARARCSRASSRTRSAGSPSGWTAAAS